MATANWDYASLNIAPPLTPAAARSPPAPNPSCHSSSCYQGRKSRIKLSDHRALAGFLQKVLSGDFMKTVIIFPIHYTLITQVYYNTIWTDAKMTFRIGSHHLSEIIMWFRKLLYSSHIASGTKAHLQISQWKAVPTLCWEVYGCATFQRDLCVCPVHQLQPHSGSKGLKCSCCNSFPWVVKVMLRSPDLHGTGGQHSVWAALVAISYNKTAMKFAVSNDSSFHKWFLCSSQCCSIAF